MAYPITLGTLVTRAQQRGNDPSGEQLAVPEMKEIVSEHYGEIHAAVNDVGARYHETEATITATGAASYALPTDHLSTIGIDFLVDSAGRRRELLQLMVQERSIFAGQTGEAHYFALAGANIVLYRTPATGTYKHLYIPQPTDYSTSGDSTSVDVINIHGLRYIVWGVASILLYRAESEQQRAMVERDRALQKLVEWAIERAKGMPKRQIITDIRALGSTSNIHGAWNPASWMWR